MATDFTQDSVLFFLQSSGGSVKNSELLVHFRAFLQDAQNRDRNRELFKKFVNSVAIVKQVDGASHVLLRKKFRGHVSGAGRDSPGSAGNYTEPSASAEPEGSLLPPPGETRREAVLQAAGIVGKNQRNEERKTTQKPKYISPEPAIRQVQLGGPQVKVSPDPVTRQVQVWGQQQVKVSPDPVVRQVQLGGQQQVNIRNISPEPVTRQVQMGGPQQEKVSPDPVIRQVQMGGPQQLKISSDPVIRQAQTGGQQQVSVSPEPLIRPVQIGGLSGHPGPDQNPRLGLPTLGLQEPGPPKGLVPGRRFRYRPSYRSAVSQDDDDEDEVPVRPGPGLGSVDSEKTLPSSPCIPESQSSSSSGRTQSLMEEEIPVPPDLLEVQRQEAGSVPMETSELVSSLGPGRRLKHSPSYKTAVSQEEEEEDDEVEAPVKPGPGGGPWPQSPPGRTISGSSESAESCSSSSGRPVPHIFIQDTEDQPGSVAVEMTRPESDPAGPDQNQTRSCSPSSVLRPSDRFYSGSSRTPGRISSEENREEEGLWTIQEVQRSDRTSWHRSTGNLYDEEPGTARLSPLYHSTDRLHDDEHFAPRARLWHLSTGDLCDDREEAESSEGSASSPQVQLRSAVARRLSSRLRHRMCRSLGTDLDQIVQEGGGAGTEAARLDRLHRISSSISLFHHQSTSSLSSCTTPPRCSSPANQVEGEEKRRGGRSLGSTTSLAQSPVPLEPREHAWMVNGAVGAWSEIFSLFREDPSLLNKPDFISGFTVLHWIAKHGAHRALNTLWYGVEKFGLTFDINAKATGGQTPLHVAAIHGHKKVIQLLVVKFHADVRLRDTAGKRAWQYLDSTAPDVLQLLGAPARAALTERGGPDDTDWQPKRRRHGLRHHFSSAGSGQRPLTLTQFAKVTRSSSIAALLKHKSTPRF